MPSSALAEPCLGPPPCQPPPHLQLLHSSPSLATATLWFPTAVLAGGLRARLGACAAACGALARQQPGMAPDMLSLFTQAWCLHELCLQHLPLSDRSLRLPKPAFLAACGGGGNRSGPGSPGSARRWSEVEQAQRMFLESFHAAALSLLGGCTTAGVPAPGAGESPTGSSPAAASGPTGAPAPPRSADTSCPRLDESMADFFDGRLFACIVAALAVGLPLQLSEDAQAGKHQLQDAVWAAAAAGQAGGQAAGEAGAAGAAAGEQPAGAAEAAPGSNENWEAEGADSRAPAALAAAEGPPAHTLAATAPMACPAASAGQRAVRGQAAARAREQAGGGGGGRRRRHGLRWLQRGRRSGCLGAADLRR